ncbi:hypothetical protein B9P99_06395 [Candidatus Marsarchaeota G1 archaeon OSP_B]|uniref:Plant-type L-asparaginase n=1 Tax=Candidatus Marsarchaeota G1 archaeon OSP_B TaxID=1978153 RepID=A0A2R6AMH4_9ARCH|nr:MAG: hypothetical protein B9P99_06395 [Candidatus Marsarchaeota G1 archaeon OSP_B]
MTFGIIIHGGAGVLRTHERLDDYRKFLGVALKEGYKVLEEGGDSLQAVIKAIYVMEECGAFNAGVGCSLTVDGYAELDAGLMDGSELSVGAVASLRNVRHPIVAAHLVMTKTDHVLLVGDGALRILEALGVKQDTSLVTQEKLQRLNELKKEWLESSNKFPKNKALFSKLGTVGAIALDKNGKISAGVSTGGYWLKLSGRVGDSPITGAGFYADSSIGGAVATGIGEYAIRTSLCKSVVEFMAHGETSMDAVKQGVEMITKRFGSGTIGLIALNKKGEYGYHYNTEGMGRGVLTSEMKQPILGVFREDDT